MDIGSRHPLNFKLDFHGRRVAHLPQAIPSSSSTSKILYESDIYEKLVFEMKENGPQLYAKHVNDTYARIILDRNANSITQENLDAYGKISTFWDGVYTCLDQYFIIEKDSFPSQNQPEASRIQTICPIPKPRPQQRITSPQIGTTPLAPPPPPIDYDTTTQSESQDRFRTTPLPQTPEEVRATIKTCLKGKLINENTYAVQAEIIAEAVSTKVIEYLDIFNSNTPPEELAELMASIETSGFFDQPKYYRAFWYGIEVGINEYHKQARSYYQINHIDMNSIETKRGAKTAIYTNSLTQDSSQISYSTIVEDFRAIFSQPYNVPSDVSALLALFIQKGVQHNIDLMQVQDIDVPDWRQIENAIKDLLRALQIAPGSIEALTKGVMDDIKNRWRTGNLSLYTDDTLSVGEININLSSDVKITAIQNSKTAMDPWWPTEPGQEKTHNGYTVRCIQKEDKQDALQTTVYHLEITDPNEVKHSLRKTHIQNWPDMRTANIEDIIESVKDIDLDQMIALNCKAGKGRSVTLSILLDLIKLRKEGRTLTKADARALIMRYKSTRTPGAVETWDQYKMILDAVDIINQKISNRQRPSVSASFRRTSTSPPTTTEQMMPHNRAMQLLGAIVPNNSHERLRRSYSRPGYYVLKEQNILIHQSLASSIYAIESQNVTDTNKKNMLADLYYLNPQSLRNEDHLSLSRTKAKQLIAKSYVQNDAFLLRTSTSRPDHYVLETKDGSLLIPKEHQAIIESILNAQTSSAEKITRLKLVSLLYPTGQSTVSDLFTAEEVGAFMAQDYIPEDAFIVRQLTHTSPGQPKYQLHLKGQTLDVSPQYNLNIIRVLALNDHRHLKRLTLIGMCNSTGINNQGSPEPPPPY